MKRVLRYLLIGFIMFPVCASAQTRIGYTNGDFNRTDGVRLSSGTTQSAAIKIPASKLAKLAGAKVTGIRSVFGTRSLDNVKFFVKADLDGESLYEQQLSGFSTQWRDYDLTTPFELTGERDLYFGFEITCSEAYSPLAFDRCYTEPGCIYGYLADGWADLSSSSYGNLNMQLLVEGVPSFTDATVRMFNADGYYKAGQEYSFQGQLFNFGTEPITSFEVTSSVTGGQENSNTVSGVNIGPGEVYNFDLTSITSDSEGYKDVRVTVGSVNGADDELADDNTRSGKMYFYPADMKRSYLVETFTGQQCSNCAEGHAVLEEALEESGESFVQLSYHSGYSPDDFTMLEDYYYQQFFGVTGAPSFMVNRYANPNINPLTPVFSLMSPTTVTKAYILENVRAQSEQQPYVGVDINTSYDEATRQLTGTVTVKAYRTPEVSNPSLIVGIMQDSIVAFQMPSSSGLGGANYVHRHAFRGGLNGLFGEKMNITEGEEVVKEITYTLPESITSTYDNATSIPTDLKNMHIVAIVANYESGDVTDCVVLNCAEAKFGSSSTAAAIGGVTAADGAKPVARLTGTADALRAEGNFDCLYIYNVGGRMVRKCSAGDTFALTPGVYVTRAVKDGQTATAKAVVAR